MSNVSTYIWCTQCGAMIPSECHCMDHFKTPECPTFLDFETEFNKILIQEKLPDILFRVSTSFITKDHTLTTIKRVNFHKTNHLGTEEFISEHIQCVNPEELNGLEDGLYRMIIINRTWHSPNGTEYDHEFKYERISE